jgi:hypothetical protein
LVAQFYGIFGFRISALWSQMCKAQWKYIFYYHIIVVLGVHCDTYKCTYNIS